MPNTGRIAGVVRDKGVQQSPIFGAKVTAISTGPQSVSYSNWTDRQGRFRIPNLPDGTYTVQCHAFGGTWPGVKIPITHGWAVDNIVLEPEINLTISTSEGVKGGHLVVGTPVEFTADYNHQRLKNVKFKWTTALLRGAGEGGTGPELHITPSTPGVLKVSVTLSAPTEPSEEGQTPGAAAGEGEVQTPSAAGPGAPPRNSEITASAEAVVDQGPITTVAGKMGVTLGRTTAEHTLDQALWIAIRNRTRAISFTAYQEFIDRVLCRDETKDYPNLRRDLKEASSVVHGVGAFQVLKAATEAFLLTQCGVFIRNGYYDSSHDLFDQVDESRRVSDPIDINFVQDMLGRYLGTSPYLPYIARVIAAAFPGLKAGSTFCENVLMADADKPCLLELIWSYWHEEGMLVQSVNAVSRRFQNVRGPGDRDPLAHLEIDPLRPLNHLFWGYIQDEPNLLTVRRRAYEYDHHYGLALYGKAIAPMRPADSRSKFLEAFHNLLHLTSIFFKEDNDTTVIADGYPLLNGLREVHLLLAQGAHNQFGDLPWTARTEMLMQEWFMARPEMRDFLQSRVMVPYKEGWMPQVDTMKTLQGWSDVTVTHFRDLGAYGEQILLSIRYGDWIDINDEDSAKNWARYWRPEIQGYLHAYRAVTGIDLTNPDTVDATMPAIHLQKRLAIQQRVR